jgi:iron-sulfur cluster repair protein YtfE (RIC family)
MTTPQNTTIQNTNDLLDFLVKQMAERRDWFGRSQQKLTTINLAHKIAEVHAPHMTPKEVVAYAAAVNQEIFDTIINK